MTRTNRGCCFWMVRCKMILFYQIAADAEHMLLLQAPSIRDVGMAMVPTILLTNLILQCAMRLQRLRKAAFPRILIIIIFSYIPRSCASLGTQTCLSTTDEMIGKRPTLNARKILSLFCASAKKEQEAISAFLQLSLRSQRIPNSCKKRKTFTFSFLQLSLFLSLF